MNIFYISKDPEQAATWMVDKHVVKMILESAQLLSTAHRIIDGLEYAGKSKTGRNQKSWVLKDGREMVLYKATHVNHPSALWCRQSIENYNWLAEHFFALLDEYTYRYEKKHKCADLGSLLQFPPSGIREYNMTTMPSCMDLKYVISYDPIENYRNYYKHGKASMHFWKKRQPPEWITQ